MEFLDLRPDDMPHTPDGRMIIDAEDHPDALQVAIVSSDGGLAIFSAASYDDEVRGIIDDHEEGVRLHDQQAS